MAPERDPPLVYLIAGELSGDRLGAALMAGLRHRCPDIRFAGIGGPLMQAQQLCSLFDMTELSVMGIAEVLPKLRSLFRRRDEAVADILKQNPAVLITIDSPDFCLRVARKVKAASSMPTIHYVAPSVWAWRPKRAQKMRGVIDHVLALLPFEPPYMEAAGMGCDFVGHPVVSEPVATDADASEFRKTYDLGNGPVLLALPGSRMNEVSRLVPIFGEALSKLVLQVPELRVVIPAAGPVASRVRALAQHWPGDPLILDPNNGSAEDAVALKRAAFKSADLALAASGTVSLELAANETPMVIAYDMNWMTWQMMKRMAQIDTVTLVNLVTQSRTVPEFLGDGCKPDPIARALATLLHDEPARQKQIEACRRTMELLGKGQTEPGLRAADAVLRVSGLTR
ncbi:MAG: lipid-A-disaccharide synthase [Pseudomonadota bacterium]